MSTARHTPPRPVSAQTGERVLNLGLYNQLRHLFGRVSIHDRGAGFSGQSRFDQAHNRWDMVVADPGEYYAVNCPWCGDTRQRLWINHRFGEFLHGRRMIHLAICYNEDCLADWERRVTLCDQIYGLQNRNNRDVVWQSEPGEVETASLTEVGLPGECIPVEHLPSNHPALQYMLGRNYAMETLVRFRASFCQEALPQYRAATGRIIVPIYMHNVLVGWQGRWPADLNWRAVGFPKYYTLPGMPKRQILYNWDIASRFPYIVVHEGITDVWSSGPHSVALLGKTLSQPQQRLLTLGRSQPIVLMLDGGEEERETMNHMVEQLTHHTNTWRSPVVVCCLPDGTDPGSYTQDAIQNMIYAAAARAGVTLPPTYAHA